MGDSFAYATAGNQVGGEAAIGGISRPILWNAATMGWTELTPGGFVGGEIRAVRGGRQAGAVATMQTAHASLWSGTVESFVDLHPANNPYISEVHGMDNQQQVGHTRPTLGSPYHRAALWSGTAASYVSLHPAGVIESKARAVSDGEQGGFFRVTEASGYHAALWSGTAQSMKDLHPAGAVESQILGVAAGQQVGWVGAPVTHAAMWHGTAESFIDMGPPGSGFSTINATCGSAQAGFANFAGDIAPVVWFGSPTNFIRLDAFLPADYGQAIATGISQVNGVYYVSGYADRTTGPNEAFVWVGVPAPGAFSVLTAAGIFAARRSRKYVGAFERPVPNCCVCSVVIALGTIAIPGQALAQNWIAIRLHDNAMRDSFVYATDGGLVGGTASIGGGSRPILWDSGAGTWSNITPNGFLGGDIRAAYGGRQGGGVGTGQTGHAALWSGTADSFVDLHPTSNPYISEVQGMDDQQQVGHTRPTLGSPYHRAALWSGTAASYLSLHPAGVIESEARAVSDGEQGGFYRVTETSGYHAALWSGTAQSMKDLHPAGAVESQILGVAAGQQVGWAGAPVTHAAMWHGTAESFIDMAPPGSGFSTINATCGTAQAGYANFAGDIAPVVWFGSPTNFVRLDAFLPANYGQAIATGISQINGVYYVSGYADRTDGPYEAFVWVGVPAPGALALLAGMGLYWIRRARRGGPCGV